MDYVTLVVLSIVVALVTLLAWEIIVYKKMRVGVVKNQHVELYALGGSAILFEIHQTNGRFWRSGIYMSDWENDLADGAVIRFWVGDNLLASIETKSKKVERDGTRTLQRDTQKYYELERYRIVSQPHKLTEDNPD